MYELIKRMLLKMLKVPPEPIDPFGTESSVRTFRAAPNFYRYRLFVWAIGAVIATIGNTVGVILFHYFIVANTSGWLRTTLNVLTVVELVAFFIGLIFSGLMVRLDYEMRWYKVSDRSLRIREGVWLVREMTMTFANIQNLSITQGPVQRYLGISDLMVQTAGGGGGQVQEQQGQGFNMHLGFFRGVDNAEEIRNLIRERLRRLKDSGLGDLEESTAEDEESSAEMQPVGQAALLEELRALHEEARLFRAAVQASAAPPSP